MAKYTTELRDIVKSGLNIFNFDYTFYDDTKKPEFEQMFIDHFFFHEIGCETVGRFQHYLKVKCHEVLPYYNKLFETALYEYDVKNNYNLTETFTKVSAETKTVAGAAEQTATTAGTTEAANTLNRTNQMTGNSEKINTLDSRTEHDENVDVSRTENVTEAGHLNKLTVDSVDGKKVSSDTPSGLLAMASIEDNVYASNAVIDKTLNNSTDNQNTTAEKEGETAETTETSIVDKVEATSGDSLTESRSDTATETANATSETAETATSNATTTQNASGNVNESYTLERVGDIGVDTTPDKLRKHLEIQKTLTTIYTQFFAECDDLFMQIY